MAEDVRVAANVDYWRKGLEVQNFGDALSKFFLENLFYPVGLPAQKIHLVGSTISDLFVPDPSENQSDASILFWGCGSRGEGSLSDSRRSACRILSVRGPLSASELRLGDTVPVGDPGLLLPALYKPKTAQAFVGKTVCVPHFHDTRTDQQIKDASGCQTVLRSTISNDLESITEFIDAVWSSDFVLSSSLHGAVVAAAYEKRFAFWQSGSIDLPFKWADFAASIGIEAEFYPSVTEAELQYDNHVKDRIRLPSMWQMLTTSPMLIRPTSLLQIFEFELQKRPQLNSIDAMLAQLGSYTLTANRIIASLQASEDLADEALRIKEALAAQEAALQREASDAQRLRTELTQSTNETNLLRGTIEEFREEQSRLRLRLVEAKEQETLAERVSREIQIQREENERQQFTISCDPRKRATPCSSRAASNYVQHVLAGDATRSPSPFCSTAFGPKAP